MCWVDEDEGLLQDLLAYMKNYTCIFYRLLVTIYLQQNGLRRIETGYLGNNWLFTFTTLLVLYFPENINSNEKR